jgi:hypothetical protein
VAMKMTRVTTGERLPGAHPTSKHMYRDLKNKQWLTCP